MTSSIEDVRIERADYTGPHWRCPECGEEYYGWKGSTNTCDSCQCDLLPKALLEGDRWYKKSNQGRLK